MSSWNKPGEFEPRSNFDGWAGATKRFPFDGSILKEGSDRAAAVWRDGLELPGSMSANTTDNESHLARRWSVLLAGEYYKQIMEGPETYDEDGIESIQFGYSASHLLNHLIALGITDKDEVRMLMGN